ncbi:hypothetical protein, partial [Lysobacter enzymogenes]|uniref:hypothetical protein n=1 Tax=Lysobacter enzymogenes TaxID=69 RepID=UPI00197B76DE
RGCKTTASRSGASTRNSNNYSNSNSNSRLGGSGSVGNGMRIAVIDRSGANVSARDPHPAPSAGRLAQGPAQTKNPSGEGGVFQDAGTWRDQTIAIVFSFCSLSRFSR